ncbi:hypothetical protein J4206_02255 [Candidatus Woesearchaeota archaeon]|nr:hypothetical protein [Candidatus Woesearchaeota archaeon]
MSIRVLRVTPEKIKEVPVTSRDVGSYSKAEALILDPSLQYIEIGAGLGGFIPAVVNSQQGYGPKPIVIDPCDYHSLYEMMNRALHLDISDQMRSRLDFHIERCKVYLSDNVVLLNMWLGDAIRRPDLVGIADIVVDNLAALLYGDPHTGFDNGFEAGRQQVEDWEKLMLKENGLLITEYDVIYKKDGVFLPGYAISQFCPQRSKRGPIRWGNTLG